MGSLLSVLLGSGKLHQESRDYVNHLLDTIQVVMFSQNGCLYSEEAKKLLVQEYPELGRGDTSRLQMIDLNGRPDIKYLKQYFEEVTGTSTMPRIFISGQCIGGFEDLWSLHESGQLRELIRHHHQH